MNPGFTCLGICYLSLKGILDNFYFVFRIQTGGISGVFVLLAPVDETQREVQHVMSALWQRVGCQQEFLLKLWI